MDRPSWAQNGMKVVCIDNSNQPGLAWNGDGPVVGAVYTIVDAEWTVHRQTWALKFAEIERIPRHPSEVGKLFGYYIHRFKPLHTAETDMKEHFEKLLNVPVKEDV